MQTITVDELKARINAGQQLNLVDVREDVERAEFNIGGLHHRLGLIQSGDVEKLEHLKGEEIICYCRSGNRSGIACTILEQMGFSNTVNVAGGMLDWMKKFGK